MVMDTPSDQSFDASLPANHVRYVALSVTGILIFRFLHPFAELPYMKAGTPIRDACFQRRDGAQAPEGMMGSA
jgi:hypothetical protein